MSAIADIEAAAALAWLLRVAALAGCLVVVCGATVRLWLMHPGKTSKWSWALLYLVLWLLGWLGGHLVWTRAATLFEQAACVLAGLYILATIPSWRLGLPGVVRKNYGRRKDDIL